MKVDLVSDSGPRGLSMIEANYVASGREACHSMLPVVMLSRTWSNGIEMMYAWRPLGKIAAYLMITSIIAAISPAMVVGQAPRFAIEQPSPPEPRDADRLDLQIVPPSPPISAQKTPAVNPVERPTFVLDQLPGSLEEPFSLPPTRPMADDALNRSIRDITTNTRPPAGDLPEVLSAISPGSQSNAMDPETGCRPWYPMVYRWHAPDTCHLPLYFEDVNLERYGYIPRHMRLAQPAISGARFLVTVPALPYLMASQPPCRGIYSLGDYRPGSCVPYQRQRVPLRPVPAGVEAAAITGLLFAIP